MNPDAIFPGEEKTVRRRRTLQAEIASSRRGANALVARTEERRSSQ